MKTRMIALLLLLVIALTACSSAADPDAPLPSVGANGGTGNVPDVDTGVIDGDTYKNMDLGVCLTLPDGWSFCEDDALAALNGMDAATYDRASILDAINAGRDVVIFRASDSDAALSTESSALPSSVISISASLNPLPDADPDGDAFVNHFTPLMRKEYEAYDAWTLLACDPFDADYCGEDHVVLHVTAASGDFERYLSYMYLPCGDLLYTLTVSTAPEDARAEILRLFEPIG